MRAIFSRIVKFLGRLRDLFPLTARGLIIAGLAALALHYLAYGSLDFVVLVVGYAALFLIAVSLPLTILGAAYLSRRLNRAFGARRGHEGEPLRLVAGRFLPSDLRIPSLRYLPLIEVEIEMDQEGFERRERARDEGGRGKVEELRAQHRGLIEALGRKFRVRDAFGLTEITLRRRFGEAFVLPDPGRYEPSLELISATLGDEHAEPFGAPEGDRIDLRRYHPGDPARFIHWKIYARTGELMLRSPEVAIKRADRIALYLIAGPGDEAASALALTLVKGLSFDDRVVFGVDGTPGLIAGSEEAARAIARSRDFEGGTQLMSFLAEAEREGPVALVLLTPQRPGEWLGALDGPLRSRLGKVRAIIGVDGISGGERSFLRRVFFREPQLEARRSPQKVAQEIAEVEGRLRAFLSDVYVADRKSGTIDHAPRALKRSQAA